MSEGKRASLRPSIIHAMAVAAMGVLVNRNGLDSQGFGHGSAYPDKRTHATKERNREHNRKAQAAAKRRKKR